MYMFNKPPPLGSPPLSRGSESSDFDQFRLFLEDACGISLGDNKQYLVTNRIRRILDDYQFKNLGELVVAVRQGSNRKLKEQVVDAMTTNETFWFRDVYPFEHLRNKILPELMSPALRMQGPIRIWSAACSYGQEPYSISMMVEEYKRASMGTLNRPVQIVATDLSSIVLDQARSGEYDKMSIIRGLSTEKLERYFDKQSDNLWRIKPPVKERIDFKSLNLLDSYASLGRFDIVFCRNVLIYFNADLKREVMKKIHSTLKPGGILYLGSSEGLAGSSDLFEMVRSDPGILYRAI
jgi:chemotaxis protein methyltransferase CheR